MALNLTAAELQEVSQRRKTERPSYYNAALDRDIQISEDFEAFLILTPTVQKKQAVSWIGQTATLKQRQYDIDLLMLESIQKESESAQAAKAELDAQLATFQLFRESLSTGKFATIPELSTMLRDLQFGLDDLIFVKERIEHLKAMLDDVERDITSLGLSEEQIQQTQGWLASLMAY